MIDFLVTYVLVYLLLALCFFGAAITISKSDCKEKNARFSHRIYRVNYKRCIFKSLLFPYTIAQIINDIISESRN